MNTGFLREHASANGQIEAGALEGAAAFVLVAVADVLEDTSESLESGGA